MSTNNERAQSKLHEMVVRGTDFKEDYEFELYGEDVTVILQPLVDDEFLPIAAFLATHLDVDNEEEFDKKEAVSESIDKIDGAEDEDGDIDVSKLDEEFVEAIQQAARRGIYGGYNENGEVVEHTEEEIDMIVSNAMGGASVEIGGRVLEISGDVRDAEKFRGGRGRVASTRDS